MQPIHLSDDDVIPSTWSRLRQDAGVVIWSGFLAACVASLFFFAVFDPLLLGHDQHPPRWLADRMTGYTVVFFFFWFVTSVAAVLTAFLIDTRSADSQ